ncbi:MAG: alpha/beta fold hydrolase [Sphingomonadales bacterium]
MNLLAKFFTGAIFVAAAFYFFMIVPEANDNADVLAEPGSLDDKVGFYTLEDGRRVLMTYSVKRGMKLYHLDDGVFRWRNDLARQIYLGDGDQYIWKMNEGLPDRSLRFQYDSTGDITGFSWTSVAGEFGIVARDNEPPYTVREVSFFNGDTELSGTLLIPPDGLITGGAVLIHGSGDSHRDNLWYFIIAERLAKTGLVTLLPDKRGSGKSKGEWEVASFTDFAGDAIAGVNVVKAVVAVPSDRVGLVGISQGGWIAPLAADMDQSIAYVINLSGALVTPSEQLVHEVGGSFAAFIAKMRRWTWWNKNGDFDPVPYWTTNPQPGLIMYGIEDEDDNVPVFKSTEIIRGIQQKRDDLALIVYEGVGHSLAIPETGEMIFLDDMTNWIHELSANDYDNGSAASQPSGQYVTLDPDA